MHVKVRFRWIGVSVVVGRLIVPVKVRCRWIGVSVFGGNSSCRSKFGVDGL